MTTTKHAEMAREIVNKVNEEFNQETFVSEGYGYFDDMVEAIAQALESVEREASMLRGSLATKMYEDGYARGKADVLARMPSKQ